MAQSIVAATCVEGFSYHAGQRGRMRQGQQPDTNCKGPPLVTYLLYLIFLKFPQPPEKAPAARNKTFKRWTCGERWESNNKRYLVIKTRRNNKQPLEANPKPWQRSWVPQEDPVLRIIIWTLSEFHANTIALIFLCEYCSVWDEAPERRAGDTHA